MAKKSKVMEAVKRAARMDGWKNILTGLGIKGKDRRKASRLEWEIMDETEADDFYSASDIARKVVGEVVADAFREGYELQADDLKKDKGLSGGLEEESQRLQVDDKLAEAWELSRLYGGSGIIAMPRDITKLSQPLIPESIDEIQSLLVLSRWELPRQTIETDVRSPNFARPKTYRICPRTGADQMNEEVHHSRVLRFDGAYLTRIRYFRNNLWHDSYLNVCKDPIRDYDAALAAVSATLDDFSIGVMKMKDLTRNVAEDADDLITRRLEIMNISRSVAKMIVIDADSEEFTYQDRQLAGVADCVKLIAGRLVVASNMPHTKILGESPQGSNATGNSTTKDWYDHVGSQQRRFLNPRLIALWKWILAAKKSPTRGKVPMGLKALYRPLWQEPDSVQAGMRFQQAQSDQIYIQNGVVEPAEVAISRFGSGEYSNETQLIDDRKPGDVMNPEGGGKKPPPDPNNPPQAPGNPNPTKPFKPNDKATSKLEKAEAEV